MVGNHVQQVCTAAKQHIEAGIYVKKKLKHLIIFVIFHFKMLLREIMPSD